MINILSREVGSHLCAELIKKKYNVFIIDNLSNSLRLKDIQNNKKNPPLQFRYKRC